MLVGVPISVDTPTTFEAITSGRMNASGSMPRTRAIWTVIGVMSNIVVTLSSKAEATPVISIRMGNRI